MVAPRPILDHYQGGSLTHSMLITGFIQSFDPKVTENLEGSLGSHAPSEVWTGNFPIHLQRHISLNHSPRVGLFKMILLIVASEKYHNIMLIWSLKQVVDFILNFSINGSFFSEKEFFNLNTMILVSFPSCGCIAEVFDNWENFEGYKYVYSLQHHTLTVIYFMNGEGVC